MVGVTGSGAEPSDDLDDEWEWDAFRVGRATRDAEAHGPDGYHTIEEGTIRFDEINREDRWLWEEDGWMAHYMLPGEDGEEHGMSHQPFEKLGILEFPVPMTESEAFDWLREEPERWQQFRDETLESDTTAADLLEEIR